MPVAAEFNLRSGGDQFLKFAQTMCRLVNAGAPLIRAHFADRPALLAMLTAAEGVCELLPDAQSEQATMDAPTEGEFDPLDEALRPGQRAP